MFTAGLDLNDAAEMFFSVTGNDVARKAFYLRDNVIKPYQMSFTSIEKVCKYMYMNVLNKTIYICNLCNYTHVYECVYMYIMLPWQLFDMVRYIPLFCINMYMYLIKNSIFKLQYIYYMYTCM